MKVRLLKDWMGFKEGQEFEDTDGVFEFSSIEEDYSENSSSTISYNGSFSTKVIEELDDIFEVIEDEKVAEEKTELEQGYMNETNETSEDKEPDTEDTDAPSKSPFEGMKDREEVTARLDKIYKDIEILKNFKSDSDVIGDVAHVLENMAYSLEWVLGNINE